MKWAALPLFWLACVVAGYFYTQQREVPWSIVQILIPAFLLEATLFLSVGIESWRARLEKLPKPAISGLLVLAAVAPYCLASVPFHTFTWEHFWALAGLAAVLSFWYVALPHNPLSDLSLLTIVAAVMLTKVFRQIYVRPHDHLALEILGKAMWIRTGLFAMLSIRKVKGVGFGFWPRRSEWVSGVLHFLVFLPIAAGVAKLIGFASPERPPSDWPILLPVLFAGSMYGVALGEEFLFRGLLQRWMTDWLRNQWAGIVAASLLFGSVHLWYTEFPNWRLAVLAAIAGLFYGNAFRLANSIRASMVTHALTVTTWKLFFS
jgi:membrane protease YdiL (CAAX protease family)